MQIHAAHVHYINRQLHLVHKMREVDFCVFVCKKKGNITNRQDFCTRECTNVAY